MIQELRNGEQQPLIVQGQAEPVPSMWGVGSWGMRGVQNKKKKAHTIFNEHPDVETYFGWSVTVSEKEMDVLKHTDFSVFMVNLTKVCGSKLVLEYFCCIHDFINYFMSVYGFVLFYY